MKQVSVILILFLVSLVNSFGQASTDSITIKKVFGGYQFYQGEKMLMMNDLLNVMESNDQAYEEMKAAKKSNTLATVFGTVGGFLVGLPIGTALGGGEPEWGMLAVGGGLVVVSVSISQKFNRQARQAVETFNSGKQTTSFWDEKELKLSMRENGVGLTLCF